MDLRNYKGIYFQEETEKYTDPVTGAHFRRSDLLGRLDLALKQRIRMEAKKKFLHQKTPSLLLRQLSESGSMSDEEKSRFEKLKAQVIESKLDTSFSVSEPEPAAEEFAPIR